MKTKLKILLCSLALVLVVGLTAVTVWALTRTETSSSFKINFVGKRHVEASIKATSYLSDVVVEEKGAITFSESSQEATESLVFAEEMNVTSTDDVVSYVFEVTNITEKTSYNDLIIEPKLNLSADFGNVISSLYYSVDGGATYKAMDGQFLTAHQGDTIVVRLDVIMTERGAEAATLEGSVDIVLSSEDDKPAGYEQKYVYSVENGVAYRDIHCATCGEVVKAGEPLREGTYVIATPANVQEVIDGDINNKIVIFDAGEYNDPILFRPSQASNSKAYTAGYNAAKTSDFVAYADLKTSSHYLYERSFKNITFAGVEGANFNEMFIFDTGYITGGYKYPVDYATYPDPVTGDAVVAGQSGTAYTPVLQLENIKFTDLNFNGARGRIFMNLDGEGSFGNNISVENCSFINTGDIEAALPTAGQRGSANNRAAFYINCGTAETVNIYNRSYMDNEAYKIAGTVDGLANVVFKNNVVDGHGSAFNTYKANNVLIANNNIKNISLTCLQLQGGNDVKARGNYVVVNNTFANSGERAIRIAHHDGSKVLVANNEFANCLEGENLLKATNFVNTSVEFVGNTYTGYIIDNFKVVEGQLLIDILY